MTDQQKFKEMFTLEFAKIDIDHKNSISTKSVDKLLSQCGIKLNKTQCSDFIEQFDADKTEKVQFDVLLHYTQNLKKNLELNSKLVTCLDQAKLNKKKAEELLKAIAPTATIEEIEEITADLQLSDKQTLNGKEFVEKLMPFNKSK